MNTLFAIVLLGGLIGQDRPKEATGLCKDGTYTTSAVKTAACHGHKGIHTWYADAPALTPFDSGRSGIAEERAKLLAQPPAAGGGPGLVWLNGTGKVYHCPASSFYGKTKTGSYVTEADAKARGAHPARNKPCV
ncbi:Protein of unknown function [Granulicella pectinivorans]|uniref:DUF3761 domain-containing protein n=1 Tax=Granulicella pectinivorans TaxID=474950 RepID=A0A1I6ME82_9BACT|nr:DUF3761 domain-containing protein [Granulicella pectinivorans]SFS14029.1 Protein of unknown function [Granulicella pectinivorans]